MNRTGSAANYVLALLVILSLNFILPRLMPGDPLQAIYGEEALTSMSEELKKELTRRFSLDRTLGEQFLVYWPALLKGDLGYSYFYNAPVLKVILGFLPWTVLLTGLALTISTLLGLLLGIESAYRRGLTLDRLLLSGMMFISGFPDFFVGILLLLFFGVFLQLMPLAGALTPYAGYSGLALALDVLHHLVLPVAALVLARLTATYLLTRNAMIATLGEAFILTARAKGCPERVIRYRHAGRSSLLPVVTAAGLQFTHLVTGALFIEIVFNYPGMGSLLYKALLARDYPLLQGVLLLVALVVLVVNFLVDFLYAKIDPRVVANAR
ncbi:MAG: ABC transporter permease [Pelotomaculum sp.]|uniref:ABC-type dipeptide/oligopeptide/nickel transport systems, permease components n=1 Tax=Pelotomaculum thermopropionicum (strain DSM 13744 / JCM 10971 / SI) TaxID=370438 RepID=A5D267_PELTS|nr:ABC transporter permease [Pelotomaculum sp.]BAF59668.1 ABC-type dipeptide/oligopeptide/nickel transport systems, permease components [Pelotomaculum thermopropionicum SI]